jgi:hypothetical protein
MARMFTKSQLRAIHAAKEKREDIQLNKSIEKYDAKATRIRKSEFTMGGEDEFLVTVGGREGERFTFPNRWKARRSAVPAAAQMAYQRTVLREKERGIT